MFEEIKNEIIKYGKLSGGKNYTPGISGNISVRTENNVVITSSGSANGMLAGDDFSVIDFEGNIIEGAKPSSEKFLHLEYYRQREDINAILHFHSPCLTAFAASALALDAPILPEIVFCFGNIPLAKYALPGSKDLVAETAKYFKTHDVILMQNHGVIAGGKDLKDAYLKLELCEEYARTMIFSKILGGAKILSDEDVEKINSLK